MSWDRLARDPPLKFGTPVQNFMFRVTVLKLLRRVQINRTLGNSPTLFYRIENFVRIMNLQFVPLYNPQLSSQSRKRVKRFLFLKTMKKFVQTLQTQLCQQRISHYVVFSFPSYGMISRVLSLIAVVSSLKPIFNLGAAIILPPTLMLGLRPVSGRHHSKQCHRTRLRRGAHYLLTSGIHQLMQLQTIILNQFLTSGLRRIIFFYQFNRKGLVFVLL